MSETIHQEYTRRKDAHRASFQRFARTDRIVSNWRLAAFGLLAIAGWAAFSSEGSLWWTVLPPLFLFIAFVVYHARIITLERREELAAAYFDDGLARLEDRWQGRGTTGTGMADADHPYARDLDLFGRGSLFNLLCAARTQEGKECLAEWLKEPANPVTIRERNGAVAELRDKVEFREDFALLADYVGHRGEWSGLAKWASQPAMPVSKNIRAAAWLFAGLNVLAVVAWYLGHGLPALYSTLIVSQVFRWRVQKPVSSAHKFLARAQKQLELIKVLLERIEREQFQSNPLQHLQEKVAGGGKRACAQIAKLESYAGWQDAHKNVLVAGISGLLLFSLQLAFSIELWRVESGPRLGIWVDAVCEMEALCSLATFSYEHPEYPFPEIVDGEPCFSGQGLVHPLIPKGSVVANDITIGDPIKLFVVSGSNMSGKSTLLRTIGVNVVLALAGAPVCAESLRLTPMNIGASIQTTDSIQAGISRFYAEITRLRQITDIAENDPRALFLLDEILHGTNSHDRRIGAEAVVRALLKRGAIGLMTTHDLALAKIAEDESLAAANVHFQDEMVEGKMEFDYRLRPGVVEHSNAIELMRAVGLDV